MSSARCYALPQGARRRISGGTCYRGFGDRCRLLCLTLHLSLCKGGVLGLHDIGCAIHEVKVRNFAD